LGIVPHGGLAMSQVKDEVRKLLDEIPEEATWDDIMYEFYVRKKVSLGLADLDAGRMVSQEEVEKKYVKP
jgi:predicted transcriptional regulator